ncbi:MAG: hypothetical protein PHG53_09695 [Phycisphaerae bacterium]|nr:hypothetical protein [Phycisphaerae bacterium]
MQTDHLVKVEFVGTGYVHIITDSEDEVCNMITKGEGYDKQDIDSQCITSVEMIEIIGKQECEEINED